MVSDLNSCNRARYDMLTQRRGIIFLTKEFRVGVDIKFAEDAHVVILDKETLDGESVLQMLGRGSRANGCYYGTYYVNGDDGFFANTKRLLTKPTEVDYNQGHSVIRMVKTVIETKQSAQFNKTKILKILMELLEKNWKVNIADVFEYFREKSQQSQWKNLQTKVLDKIEK